MNRFNLNDQKRPYRSITILIFVIVGCIFADLFIPYVPSYMNAAEISQAPSSNHLFGTDAMGRDIFSMIWYGGRLSLFIGLLATLISTALAILYGCASGLAGEKLDDCLMRFTEILMSVPQILLVIFIQAMFGDATAVSIAIVIGLTSWMAVAKMVRSEVKQIRNADYVLAARTMHGGFFYILWNHLMPNFMSAILFMIITNLGGTIALEATLSYLGVGLPIAAVSWGSLMALSQKSMLSGSWWTLLIPGIFLVVTLICITQVGEYTRTRNRREQLL